tara:strand:- start:439 stop:1341 length:903 start_codon:yes stop_codon:yes gene_type:complete
MIPINKPNINLYILTGMGLSLNRFKILSIVLLVCSLSIVSTVSTVPAQLPDEGSDRYEYLGIRHDTRPQVCLFEPNPTHVDWDYWLEVEYESKRAVLDWQLEMTEFLPEGDWSMYTHSTVPYIEHWNKTPDDYRHCTIFLTFEAFNEDPESNALGLTGIDFSKSSHKFTYIVVYLHALEHTNIVLNFDDAKKDPITGLTKFEINLERQQLPLQTVYNIVLHEMGHGLGLGHYESLSPNGYKRSTMTPSLQPFSDQVFDIKIADKFMLGYLYGTDGYQKPQPIWISDHCLFDHGIKVIGCY